MSGLLIVNADDLGGEAYKTDAIIAAHSAGAITSATAMMWMEDSERAAERARSAGLPVGLHINLTHPFSGPRVPGPARERQRELCRRFARLGLRRWTWDPTIQRAVDAALAEQLERFAELYGGQPDHVDGHEHVHVCPNVLFSPALRGIARARTSQSPAEAAGAAARLGWRVKHAAVRRRFRTTDRFWSVQRLHPVLGGSGFPAAVALARTEAVEIMCHPGDPAEDALLASDSWRAALAGARLGSFGAL
jgi:predicted glycoside hydrolase/deacetylase ChbG (UPF0249 family)